MANFKKDVALIVFHNKPIFMLDIHTLTSKEDYDNLKKEVEKNFDEFVKEIEQKKDDFIEANENFKKNTDAKVSYIAKTIKENL